MPRTAAATPDLTDYYAACGRPAPQTAGQIQAAARKHFKHTRGSLGAYRAWMTEGGETVLVQVERDMRAAVVGAVRGR
jgi:hypothetical protein